MGTFGVGVGVDVGFGVGVSVGVGVGLGVHASPRQFSPIFLINSPLAPARRNASSFSGVIRKSTPRLVTNLMMTCRDFSLPLAVSNPASSASSGPNAVVENVAAEWGETIFSRSLYLRRTLTNNTGKPVTRLRFRITEISNGGVNTAILRALSSSDITVNGQLVKGLTLETPPSQPNGGGLNSALSAGSITLAAPLAVGAKINVQFRLGIVQGGSYRFYANVEAAN